MATEITTAQHDWVAITIQPVHVLLDSQGDPLMFTDPDEPAHTQYGCNECDQPMTGNLGTKCEGAEE